jgi:ABC-type multidrug transport system fused ATPase/permease subunit
MSGGQKARVSVARAVYSNSDIGLFDDVLSALDAGTSQTLFDNLFGNIHEQLGLLHGCGVVLVTHAQHVLQRVDTILVLDDGHPIFCGSWNELQTFQAENNLHRATLKSMQSSLQVHSLKDFESSRESRTDVTSQPSMIAKDADKSKGGVTTEEQREHGVSSVQTWLLWFKYAGGLFFVTIQIILMTCDRGSYVLIDWWLATWTTSAGQSIIVFGHEFPNQSDGRSSQLPYVVVYAIIVLFMLFFLFLRSQWAVLGGIRACRKFFSNMTYRVLHAPMSYFDTTPLGRVLNRFTYDVEQVDITLAQFMSIFIIANSWLIAGQVVMIAVVPYMAIINAMVLALYIIVLRHYRWSASDLQRLDAVSRSPIQASLAEGLDGSFTIRAFGKINHFAEQFQKYLDDNGSSMLNFVASRQWLALRLETLGAFVTLGASLAITVFDDQFGLTPGLAGLLLMWSSSMTVTLGFLMNAFSEVEAAITSIERMHSMEILPQEATMITSKQYEVDSSWPKRGKLLFRNVHLRYRPGLPLSLEGLTFTLEHGQRCALVGRTG